MDATERYLMRRGVIIDADNTAWHDLFHAEFLPTAGRGEFADCRWRTDTLLPDAELRRLLGPISGNVVETVLFYQDSDGGEREAVLILGAIGPDCRWRYRVAATSLGWALLVSTMLHRALPVTNDRDRPLAGMVHDLGSLHAVGMPAA